MQQFVSHPNLRVVTSRDLNLNYRHQAYGLVFGSPFPLYTLAESDLPVDVEIIVDKEYTVPNGVVVPQNSYTFLPGTNSAICQYDDAGLIAIEDGSTIRINPVSHVDSKTMSQMLLSVLMRLLLHQRGLLVFHAGGVIINGKSVAFCGYSGQGKSTLVAYLDAKGFPFITDDILAVNVGKDGAMNIFPGPAQIRLWPDSLAAIGEQPENVPTFYERYDKRLFRGVHQLTSQLPPLTRIYVLESASSEDTHIEALGPARALQYVMTYSSVGELTMARKDVFKDSSDRLRHLNKCAVIAQKVPVRRLIRRRTYDEMPTLVEMILHDIEQQALPKI